MGWVGPKREYTLQILVASIPPNWWDGVNPIHPGPLVSSVSCRWAGPGRARVDLRGGARVQRDDRARGRRRKSSQGRRRKTGEAGSAPRRWRVQADINAGGGADRAEAGVGAKVSSGGRRGQKQNPAWASRGRCGRRPCGHASDGADPHGRPAEGAEERIRRGGERKKKRKKEKERE